MASRPAYARAGMMAGLARWLVAGVSAGVLILLATASALAALPDGRAYEQVSPPDKNGGDIMGVSQRTRAAAAGGAVGFSSLVGFGDVQGGGYGVDYLALRTPTGWTSHGISPRQEPQNVLWSVAGPGDRLYVDEFSADLNRGVVRASPFPVMSLNADTVQNLFVRTDLRTPGLGTYELVSDSVDPLGIQPGAVSIQYKPFMAGASSDFGHVIFQSNLNLVAGATGDLQKLYEWDHGTLRLVGILPEDEGGGISPNAVAGPGVSGVSPLYSRDAISDDGSRIFFTVQDEPGSGTDAGSRTGTLYVREDASSTTRISGAESSEFWGATPDGRFVFFTTAEALLGDDDDADVDLYRYDLNAAPGSRLTLLSINGSNDTVADGVLGASEDGQRIYFVGFGQMVDGAPDVGGPLIFLWDRGHVAYVGRLHSAINDRGSDYGLGWLFLPKASRVTPDGSHLLFATYEGDQLEPHDHGTCDNGIGPCRELYVYSAEANGGAGKLSCVSCAADGAPATADVGLDADAGIGAANVTSHQNHPLTADGRWVFFSTPEPLIEADHNAVSDVYRFEVATGELALISSGAAGADDSYFMDASANGGDVFFTSREQMVGWDVDQSVDLYDARVGGGFPEPVVRRPCAGSACRGTVTSRGPLPAPESSTFRGAGNVKTVTVKRPGKSKRHRRANRGAKR